ncbi:MAG: insulinase family protein, partial [Candidatus Schekmanbacteria bacterium]
DNENIKRLFKKYYIPSMMTISVAGNFDKKQLVELAEKYFSFPDRKKGKQEPERKKPVYNSNILLKQKKLEQAHLCVGFPGIKQVSKYRYAKYLLNIILGGSISSRLFQKIREECGLAYNIYSFYFSFVDCGIVGIYSASSPENVSEIYRLIIEECGKLTEKSVTEEELAIAKESLKGSYMLSLESMNSRMIKTAKQQIFFGKFFTLDQILAEIESVSSKQLQELMKLIYKPEKVSAVVLGPVRGFVKEKDLRIN